MTVDTKKLEQFSGQFVNDLGATVHAGMVVIGERLDLYKALAVSPLTPTGAGSHSAYRRPEVCRRPPVSIPALQSQSSRREHRTAFANPQVFLSSAAW